MPENVDYTLLTETDPAGNDLTDITASSFTFLVPRDLDVHLQKSYGAGYFGDLPLGIQSNIRVDSSDNRADFYFCGLSDGLDDVNGLRLAGTPCIFAFVNQGNTGTKVIGLISYNPIAYDSYSVGAWGTNYTLVFKRISGDVSLEIYNGAALLDTLVISSAPANAMSRLYVANSYNDGYATEIGGEVSNHKLLDSGGVVVPPMLFEGPAL